MRKNLSSNTYVVEAYERIEFLNNSKFPAHSWQDPTSIEGDILINSSSRVCFLKLKPINMVID